MVFEPAPIRSVQVTSPFYLHYDDLMRSRTLPAIISNLKSTGRFYALSWTKETQPKKAHPYWDSDLYKAMEACCYYLIKKDEPQIRADVEEVVGYIQAAQWEDGYINSFFTLHDPENRFKNLRDQHELYTLGHLAEFAAAHFELTGSLTLIDVVRRMVKLVREVVLPKGGYGGHPEIELGLMRLYKITKDDVFLETAGFFIRERGKKDSNELFYFDREAFERGKDPFDKRGSEMKPGFRVARDYSCMQAHCSLLEQNSVEGHCVCAMYFLTGAAEYALTDASENKNILFQVEKLFWNTVNQKMYITGGIGSVARNEGFGPDYWLPDLQAGGCCFSETCASYGLIMLCERLLRGSLKGVYGDTMERTLLNCILGAVGSEGDTFYYENPLATLPSAPWKRSRWFETSCCPPNIAKVLGLLPSLVYSTLESTIAVHLFVTSTFVTSINGNSVTLDMDSGLPWNGSVTIKVQSDIPINLAIRIPLWAMDRYRTSTEGDVKDGYLYIFVDGPSKTVELCFPTEPRFVYAHPATRKDEVAVTRGPLVYCAEGIDNDFNLETTYIDTQSGIAEDGEINIGGLKSVPVLKTRGKVKARCEREMPLYTFEPAKWDIEEKTVTLIPYFLRMNRGGNGAMRVWLKDLCTY